MSMQNATLLNVSRPPSDNTGQNIDEMFALFVLFVFGARSLGNDRANVPYICFVPMHYYCSAEGKLGKYS